MSKTKRIFWPIGAGLAGAIFLTALYFGLVSWAESFQHAKNLFWEDRWIVTPLIIGFGVQMALYVTLKMRLFVPVENMRSSGAITGASGTTSALAMVACCVHHVTDVLPILGLTAASAFLAEYQIAFMLVGLGTTFVGIVIMVFILIRERNKVVKHMRLCTEVS